MKLITEKRCIDSPSGRMKLLILRTADQTGPLPGILWIHGGGYALGMAEMVHFSRGKELAEHFGAVVLSPEYRLSGTAPYPAALDDCCSALVYMNSHAEELGIDPRRLIVGGESAGGGLAAAVCLRARDEQLADIALQIPLYPMLSRKDTDSSRDNHAHVWNTKRNHWGWKKYLGPLYGSDAVPSYASPAESADYKGLPPAYTFVCDGEPFLDETLTYIRRLRDAGICADADVYHANTHAFDLLLPWLPVSRKARRVLLERTAEYFVRNEESPEL